MSVNVYLKESVRQSPQFKVRTTSDGSTLLCFDGMSIFNDKGRLHVMLNDTDIVPPALDEFVAGVSMHVRIAAERTKRERGIYRHQDAEAEVEIDDGPGGRQNFLLMVKAEKLESAWALVRMIKAGTIRPTESFEGAQSGKSRAELEVELTQAECLIGAATTTKRALETQLRKAQADLQLAQERVMAAYKLATELAKEPWPWCCKSTMTERLHKILGDAPDTTVW